MRIHAAQNLEANAWADTAAKNGSPARVQFRIGVNRYSATAEEARQLADDLLAAADEVERTPATGEAR